MPPIHTLTLKLRILITKWREFAELLPVCVCVCHVTHVYSEPQACPIPAARSAQAMYVRYCAIPVRMIAVRQGHVKSTRFASNTAW